MLNDYVNDMRAEFQSLKQPEIAGLVNTIPKVESLQHLKSQSDESDKRSTLEQQ